MDSKRFLKSSEKQNNHTIKTPHLAVFIARRNSGKSYVMRYLLNILAKAHRFNCVYVVSPTKHNGEWTSIVGDDYVFDNFDEDFIQGMLDAQALHKREMTEDKRIKANPILLILDDCLGSTSFHQQLFTKLATTGRHYDLTIWASFQQYTKCPPVIRSNCDYLHFLNASNSKTMRVIHEEQSPTDYDDWQDFQKYLREATLNYGVVLLDNTKAGKLVKFTAPTNQPKYKIDQ